MKKSQLKKSQMSHEEKKETPKQEASYHGESFLRKALAHKQGLSKSTSFKRK